GQPLTGSEPGLVASYTFDSDSGNTAKDQTPHHFDGTIGGIGGNGLVNYPYLTGAHIDPTNSTLTLTGFAPAGASIEVFISDGDPSGFGQGKTYLGTFIEGSAYDTDSSVGSYDTLLAGSANANRFRFTIPLSSLLASVNAGTVITATATVNG